VARDASGSGLSAVGCGSSNCLTVANPGVVGGSVGLDNHSDSYFSMGSDPRFVVEGDDFSLAFWFSSDRAIALTSGKAIFTTASDGLAGICVYIGSVGSPGIGIAKRSGGVRTSHFVPIHPFEERWTHIAFVQEYAHDGGGLPTTPSALKIYLDGQLRDVDADAGPYDIYARGARPNVSFQVRTCADATCSASPPFVGPGGSETSSCSVAMSPTPGAPNPTAPTRPRRRPRPSPAPASSFGRFSLPPAIRRWCSTASCSSGGSNEGRRCGRCRP
jgi:hypothetical protein